MQTMSDWMSEHATGHVSLVPNKELFWTVLTGGCEIRDFDHAYMLIGILIYGENQFISNKGGQGYFGR